MKKLLVIAALFAATAAFAQSTQSATPTQQTSTRNDAANLCSKTSGTAQQTLTITPPSGNYVYLVSLEIVSVATAAPVASAITHTSTGLPGTPNWYGGITATAGATDKVNFYPAAPLKSSTAGGVVTIVSQAAITSVTYNIQACYYYSP